MHLDPTTEGPSQASTHPMATIDDKDKKDPHGYFESGHSDESSRLLGEGSSSGAQPLETVPAYEEMHRDLPPEFQLYHADYETTSSGDIYSHDKHLNEDGEALYQFILSRAKVPPNFILKCRGTHPETRVRHVTRTETTDNRTVTRTEPEMHTETIVDFDFAIDISEHLRQLPPVLWTVPDDEPTYRGRMKREVLTDTMGGVRRVSRRILKAGKAWKETREKWGLPPWLSMTDQFDGPRRSTPADEAMPSRSELTLRQWADRYCESNKSMKSFKFRKVVYGWNTEKLTQAIRSSIQMVTYHRTPTITVQFVTSASEIDIRPSSTISRALSKTWVVVLLWLTLIYPFIWIYDRLRGGRWEVAGSAFPLRTWKHCGDSIPGESAEAYRRRTFKEVTGDVMSLTSERSDGTDDRILAETSNGVSQLIGPSERDWFLTWESTIKQCVTAGIQEAAPIITPYGMHTSALLDDFRPPVVDRFSSLGLQRDHEYSGFADLGI
ncbi:hypothetical protein RhiXN_04696 [Rhizoctonia solani]|uniref:Transmembrane protein n=1 Tax=Rhizoctonia solani TaxID=456999 RepID=A0A8H8ST46_9AGAM|nr:uncharacterized protein RhiXN_04696 [Rhizoctonia solani]QRW16694.1 hypothetical protein RhiXN_04696 [Rhizoctonia solani]